MGFDPILKKQEGHVKRSSKTKNLSH